MFRYGTLIALAFYFITLPIAWAAEEAVPNASFEQAEKPKPVAWTTQTWGGQAEFTYETIAHSGSRSVSVASSRGADAAWTIDAEVQPFSRYTLSAWIKTENATTNGGEGALINLHEMEGVKTKALTGTNDWTRVETTFDTGRRESVQINCLLGGWGLAAGKAWYDDIQLTWLSGAELKPAVTLDPSKTGEPISPYIYGQFIEHLGRCIYGGIWAEMLEDRKFYYAAGERQSPWKTLGDQSAIDMVKENSFVGEQTPEITLSKSQARGIVQDGLGLIEGKSYTGRIVASGGPNAGSLVVKLVWGDEPWDCQVVTIKPESTDYKTYPLDFTAKTNAGNGRLEITALGEGTLRIGTVSLMPSDNIHGMRADTLTLLKQLDAPIYRWPGGNFVSGYNWEDGIGDRDKRPPRKNPAWTGVEHNDFGIDEYMTFCRELGTEPLIVVNSGLGGVEAAVAELQYANGASDTPQGKRRAANGHAEPYHVKWWGIGNEMYGNWQLGFMPLEDYVRKNNLFADALRKEDPSIKLIAVGSVGQWSETMMAQASDHIDLISEHFYNQNRRGLMSHVAQIPANVKRIADAHRRYRETIPALQGKDIRIALDEWNYWYGPHLYGELGTRYFLRDALGIAAGLHEFARNSDMYYMANYAQTVNVIGCIKTTKTDASFATTGLVLRLFRHHLGTIPVEVSGTPDPLDVFAAWKDDRQILTLSVINPTRNSWELSLNVKDTPIAPKARLFVITGDDDMAYNEPGKEPQVVIDRKTVEIDLQKLTVPPISVSLYELRAQ